MAQNLPCLAARPSASRWCCRWQHAKEAAADRRAEEIERRQVEVQAVWNHVEEDRSDGRVIELPAHNRRMGIITLARQLRHIDRPVKPTRMGVLRGRLLKARVRARRGLPSRNLPTELVFKRIKLKVQRRLGSPQVAEALAQLELAILRYRLAEGRRAKRDAARRRRRPRVEETSINLWRRRRDWLLKVDPGAHGGLVEGVDPLSNNALLAALGDDDHRRAGLIV